MVHTVEANGASIPAIGLGTWTLKDKHCAELVESAIEQGLPARRHGACLWQRAGVGEGIRASGIAREDVFVTTKVWWTDIAPGIWSARPNPALPNLGLDHVDLLLIHWPNPEIPLEGSIKALNAVKKAGLASHIGVSNFPTGCFRRLSRFSQAPLVANQVERHPYLDQAECMRMPRRGHGDGRLLPARPRRRSLSTSRPLPRRRRTSWPHAGAGDPALADPDAGRRGHSPEPEDRAACREPRCGRFCPRRGRNGRHQRAGRQGAANLRFRLLTCVGLISVRRRNLLHRRSQLRHGRSYP